MNVPVSLRAIKPTGWWDDDKKDLTVGDVIVSNTPLTPKRKKRKRYESDESEVGEDEDEDEIKIVVKQETKI